MPLKQKKISKGFCFWKVLFIIRNVLQKLCRFCCNNYGDDAFFFESKTLQVFWHQRFFNTKTKRNKQREQQELCPKPKHSKTAKTMLWIKELLVQLLSSTLTYVHQWAAQNKFVRNLILPKDYNWSRTIMLSS